MSDLAAIRAALAAQYDVVASVHTLARTVAATLAESDTTTAQALHDLSERAAAITLQRAARPNDVPEAAVDHVEALLTGLRAESAATQAHARQALEQAGAAFADAVVQIEALREREAAAIFQTSIQQLKDKFRGNKRSQRTPRH